MSLDIGLDAFVPLINLYAIQNIMKPVCCFLFLY